MENNLRKCITPSLKAFSLWCIFTIVLGVFFHFIYSLSGNSFLIGLSMELA